MGHHCNVTNVTTETSSIMNKDSLVHGEVTISFMFQNMTTVAATLVALRKVIEDILESAKG